MIRHLNCHQLFRALLLMALAPSLAYAAGDPPDAPENLQGTITNNRVLLTWDEATDDDGVQGYNVYVNNQYTSTVAVNAYSGPVTAGRLYSFHVVAFDALPRRFSDPSDPLVLPERVTTGDLTIPPSAPGNLTGTLSGGQVNLRWSPSTDDEAVLGYNVFRDNRYLTTVSSNQYSGPNAAGEPGSWYVVAFDVRKNFSSRSEIIRLPDTGPVDLSQPPSTPTGLQGTITRGTDTDTISLTWQASTDNQLVAGYNIYVNGDYVATRFGTQYEGTFPTASSYAFQVTAFDFDKNYSTNSQVLTLPLGSSSADPGRPPSVPTGLTSRSTSESGVTRVTLTWQPSTGPSVVKGYDIYRNNRYLNTVSANTFTDTLRTGTAATYEVVAFDYYDNYSSRSEQLSIVGSINQAPFFARLDDQLLRTGVPWELVLAPVDVDGDATGILISNPPRGMQFVDNSDGTRSLVWQPNRGDIGVYTIAITAFDLNDTSLRSNQNIQITVVSNASTIEPPFSLQIANEAYNLIEGDLQGVRIPVGINRENNYAGVVSLEVSTESAADARRLNTRFSSTTLGAAQFNSLLTVRLGIDTLPLLPEQRRLVITARSGGFTQQASITLAVTPVPQDDVYLLIGQSNMIGLSENNAKLSEPGQADEPNPRIIQANISANDNRLINDSSLFTDAQFNFETPQFTQAEDPLHSPYDESSGLKGGSRIGMGLSFAKTALPHTTRNIILVPAAWSGSAFCNIATPAAHWNATDTGNPALGNTLLFDRALQLTNETLSETGGILRGILWHQGESDSNAQCAGSYENNLTNLIKTLRTRIQVDARGIGARGSFADIPFVAGTMSRGRDERGDLSVFSASKRLVDSTHRNIGSAIRYSAFTNNDDLTPDNGFPCGASSCIHFGAEALREMGVRTYDSLLRAATNSQ
ncbi:MAG: sialate O-acetylesterase [Granulosicoccus sp.]